MSEYPDEPARREFHATLPAECSGQRRAASVVRDDETGEWGVWLASGTPGWLEAGGSPYRALATVCAQRAERWYWQLVCGEPLRHGDDFPQHWWEQRSQIPDLDDAARLPLARLGADPMAPPASPSDGGVQDSVETDPRMLMAQRFLVLAAFIAGLLDDLTSVPPDWRAVDTRFEIVAALKAAGRLSASVLAVQHPQSQ